MSEARVGLRWYAGTDAAERYQQTLAYAGEGTFEDPSVYNRTLGDLVSPARSGSMTDVVNAVTREVGTDAAEWPVGRLVSMLAGMEHEAAQREG